MSTQATTTTTEVPVLPDDDAIAKAQYLVLDAHEAVNDIASKIFAVTNYKSEQTVTTREIGALYLFIREMEWIAESMLKDLAKIDRATWGDLKTIMAEGRMTDVPTFNEYGSLTTPEYGGN